MKLTIVIPCYNEAKNIPLILNRFDEVIGGRNIEVIFVNNGSTDNSAGILDSLVPRYSFARTILVPVNKGYGYGIIQGLKEADGDYIGWTHADMQTDPADVVKAWKIIEKYSAEDIYIKGTRIGRRFFDNVFTYGMGLFESLYFGMPMKDINAQPNIFPKTFLDQWKNPPFDFAIEIYSFILARRNKMKVIRVPVNFSERVYGQSSWNTGLKSKLKLAKRTISFSRSLKEREKCDE